MGRVRNIYLESTDNNKIGTWHLLPKTLYDNHKHEVNDTHHQLPDSVFEEALRDYPTVIYLHGNGMNRAAPFRRHMYQAISNRMNANVIAIDYRGYGDSTGVPSEEGVVDDAYATAKYVLAHSLTEETDKRPSLTLMGQSLGTAIATQCALRMYREGIYLDSLVLLAPFKALRPMVIEFKMAGIIPVLGFLNYFPNKDQILDNLVKYKFNTIGALEELVSGFVEDGPVLPPSILLMHATNDAVIPVYHAEDLYNMAEDKLQAMNKASSYHVWSSKAPDLGFVQAIMNKQVLLPERRGRMPGARFVLPRNAAFTYVRLDEGGHDHLLINNVDALQLMLPISMTGGGLPAY